MNEIDPNFEDELKRLRPRPLGNRVEETIAHRLEPSRDFRWLKIAAAIVVAVGIVAAFIPIKSDHGFPQRPVQIDPEPVPPLRIVRAFDRSALDSPEALDRLLDSHTGTVLSDANEIVRPFLRDSIGDSL